MSVAQTEVAGNASKAPRPRQTLSPCAYVGFAGVPCRFMALPGRKYCFWHDRQAPKTGPLVGPLLDQLAGEDVNLEGFQLAGIDLEYRRLPNAQLTKANLEGARLFKAHLEGAHLFAANLTNASLFKSSVAGANLRSADLTGANLLGANLKNARLEGVILGKDNILMNEKEGDEQRRLGNMAEARKFWQEAEEIYLGLLNNYRDAGRNEEAGDIFYRMMVVKRKLLPRFTLHRLASVFIDKICGYGEKPMRVVFVYIFLTALSVLFYFSFGILGRNSEHIGFDPHASLHENLVALGNCVYFSVITMTTTGYGDLAPNEVTRPFAATEAFFGAFLMAVFVMVFGRKMTR